jgi:ribosome biogenesis GTPase A
LNYSYILISSKNGHNFDYVIHKIKDIKEKAKEKRIPRPKIFIVGNTNVGKSTFINKLIQRSNKFIRDNQKNKEFYKKNYEINEDSVFDEEQEKNKTIEDTQHQNDESESYDHLEKEVSNLTTSPLPGTTIGITKVESMTLGVKLFDTPGIPNKNSISFLMENYVDMISSNITNKINPFTMNVKQGYSIWFGAIARIDFMNGDDKYFSFFFSKHVTIHRTPLLHAEDVFQRQAGKLLRPVINTNLNELNLQKQTFNLVCDKFSILNYDIVIPGLGWFSISGKGFIQIDVYAPSGIKLYVRNKPIMPYEIKARGVKKYYGTPINSNSKINRKFRNKNN